MDWMVIHDGLGAPISADSIHQRFSELPNANAKARFMREYRLLPYDDRPYPYEKELGESFNLCDDTRELDAVREVMDACARLAAIAGGMGDGERKATLNDLESVPGFERAGGGAFLHIDLKGSYWYKRFLYQAVEYDHVPGDSVFAPIPQRTLIDDDPMQGACSDNADNDPERLKCDRGTFKYSASLNERHIKALDQESRYAYAPSMKDDLADREAFRSFSNACHPYVPDTAFWTDNELVIRAAGENLRDVAGDIAHTLLLMHTGSTRHDFSFRDGFSLSAPMGICALWADFAQGVAKRPICICKTCGRPVVETHAPRGLPRVYCSDACRMKDKRREKKQAQERANATG